MEEEPEDIIVVNSEVKMYKDRVVKTKKYPMEREYYIGKLLNRINFVHFAKPLSYQKINDNYVLTMERVRECYCRTADGKCKWSKKCEHSFNMKEKTKEIIEILVNLPVEFTHYDLHRGNWINTQTGIVIIDFGQSYLNIPQAEDYLGIERSGINWDKQVETTEWRMKFGRIPTIYDPSYDIITLLSDIKDPYIENAINRRALNMLRIGTGHTIDNIRTMGFPTPIDILDDDVLDLSDRSDIDNIIKVAEKYMLANFRYNLPINPIIEYSTLGGEKRYMFGSFYDSMKLADDGYVVSNDFHLRDHMIYEYNWTFCNELSSRYEIKNKHFKAEGMDLILQKLYINQTLEILKNPKRMEYVKNTLDQYKIRHLARYDVSP